MTVQPPRPPRPSGVPLNTQEGARPMRASRFVVSCRQPQSPREAAPSVTHVYGVPALGTGHASGPREALGRQGPPGAPEGLGGNPDQGPPAHPMNREVHPRHPGTTSHGSFPCQSAWEQDADFQEGPASPFWIQSQAYEVWITCFSNGNTLLRALRAASHIACTRRVWDSTGNPHL